MATPVAPRRRGSGSAEAHRARRLGRPNFDFRGRRELLALTYGLGGAAVVVAWAIDPRVIGNRLGMAVLLGVVFAAAVTLYGLRNRLPRFVDDVAIVGSIVLIDVGLFFTDLHVFPGLLIPFYVWIGFASPLWFPRRRATLYAASAVVASGLVIAVAGTAEVLAGWVITMATLVVAFCITLFLTDSLVKRERLAVVGEMASVVGHDLRNPLAAVSNSLFLLRHSLGDMVSELQARQFEIAEREIAKAAAILEDLSAYVRPGEPVFNAVDMSSLVTEVLEVAPPREGVDVTLDVPAITVFADRVQLAQVLTNLFTNAYDAMGDHGSLRVRARSEGRTAVIEVEDDGPGIDEGLVNRIFEPFYTTKQHGTGLGLAIVRRMVEAHGGSVRLQIDGVRGTRFVVTLPAASHRFR
ncbi:MAG TPA: ATP-binding protein [Acidimicrobiales bacterium]|nr:ATP-binding protein [Acidimicrobiales bacterium]